VKKLPFKKSGCVHQDEIDLDYESVENNANVKLIILADIFFNSLAVVQAGKLFG